MIAPRRQGQRRFEMAARGWKVTRVQTRDTVIVMLLRRREIYILRLQAPLAHRNMQFRVMRDLPLRTLNRALKRQFGLREVLAAKKLDRLFEPFHMFVRRAHSSRLTAPAGG